MDEQKSLLYHLADAYERYRAERRAARTEKLNLTNGLAVTGALTVTENISLGGVS